MTPAETWTLHETEKMTIDALKNTESAELEKNTWSIVFHKNMSILQELGTKQRLSVLVESRILKIYGHVSRRDNSYIKYLVQGRVQGTRAHPGHRPIKF